MATKVLDSYALMAFFEDEPGADVVRGLIHKAVESDTNLLMSVVNLGEVWYSIARTTSPETADQYIHEIKGMGIEIVDADWALTHQAASFKASGNISYADCYAAALAKVRRSKLIASACGPMGLLTKLPVLGGRQGLLKVTSQRETPSINNRTVREACLSVSPLLVPASCAYQPFQCALDASPRIASSRSMILTGVLQEAGLLTSSLKDR